MIANPIVRASSIARRVEEGDLDVRMNDHGVAEIKQLGLSFNGMLDEVRNHRFELEAMVDSRTKSLRNSQSRLEDTSAQLRASYEAARDGIIVVGVDGNIITANQRIMEFFHMDDDWALANVSNFADNVRSKFINPNQFVSEWTSINNDNSTVQDLEWEITDPSEKYYLFTPPRCYSQMAIRLQDFGVFMMLLKREGFRKD